MAELPFSPTGNLHTAAMRELPVVSLGRTISVLRKSANQKYIRVIPPRHEGRYGQSSRNVRRGAMDASARNDEAHLMRPTKPCGPDTPMPVSTLGAQEPEGDGD
jgi:hypothetical protein